MLDNNWPADLIVYIFIAVSRSAHAINLSFIARCRMPMRFVQIPCGRLEIRFQEIYLV